MRAVGELKHAIGPQLADVEAGELQGTLLDALELGGHHAELTPSAFLTRMFGFAKAKIDLLRNAPHSDPLQLKAGAGFASGPV